MSKYLQKRQQVHLNACPKFPCLAIGYSCPHVLLTQRRRQVDQMAITTSSQKTHPGKGLRQSGPSPPHPLLYDVDDDNYPSFGIMSASLPFV